ncbi:hypothetical protein [Cellulomonas sp. ATA003]|uniref:hypothetical protein n=1 Tax=Cellulomonas sp. ATA003 TaxID=3073064 RepID=UPI0028731DE5|nr:hypothetical protein [Cellulomonas sp. ATA003]WNB86442.1 hypothetical protein REH70_04150 [Cellulomonas sp. ATA003]
MAETAHDGHETDTGAPEVTLVQIDDHGRFAVLAESVDAARTTVEALTDLREPGRSAGGQWNAVGGGAGAIAQALGGLGKAASLQGTVQLAPETLRLLAIPGNHLMQSGGQALGTVVNANGQIVANAAFVGATGAAQIATLASTVGMAVALAAIQVQLHRIEKALATMNDMVRDFVDEEREHRWADVEVRIDRIVREASWAVEAGQVPPGVLEELRGDAHALEAFSRAAARTLARRARELESTGKADLQRTRIQRDAYALARDLIDAVAAADCLYAYEVIRAAASTQDHPGPVADFHSDRVLRDAAERADLLRTEAAKIARTLQRRLRQIETRPGSGLRPGSRAQAKELAGQLAETVATIAPEPPALDIRSVSGVSEDELAQLQQELRWVPGVTKVEALFGVLAPRLTAGPTAVRQAADAVGPRDAFVAIAGGRVFIGITKDFVGAGELLVDLRADECEIAGTGTDGAPIVHTPESDIQLRPRAEQSAVTPASLTVYLRRAVATARTPAPPLQIAAIPWVPAAAAATA